ncbi:Brp/Blh family beta-carotene 15,15'-dioxygenase [Sungkyunkwania multivorans]|uniref:Probable beta-carotene 15,15'-dioxygenase n=1 Tax=Sungkyunkwania multivorans TaxID=1173618 RepID=A0ABW3CU08_9FLAO
MKKAGSIKTNLTSVMLVGTFFSLWLAVYLEHSMEGLFAYVLIFTFGILHGANDIKILQKISKNTSKRTYRDILLSYIIVVIVGAIAFYFVPIAALLLFVIFSGYHFGEQHWASKSNKNGFLAKVFFLCYGLAILFLIFYTNFEEVLVIIENLTGVILEKDIYKYSLLFVTAITCGLYLWLHFRKQIKANVVLELFFLFVFFIVFHTASLLWAFAIYFILWHSLPSMVDQIEFLYGTFTKKSFIKYLISSLIYWLISLVGLSMMYFLLRDQGKLFLSVFFAFLAAITFPHVLVMTNINEDR